MQEYAAKFYKSKAWQACRLNYAKSVGGLCEQCLKAGLYNPGVIVHHKIHITPANIQIPEITMNFDNLELLCRDCHAAMHSSNVKRYIVDENGNVTVRNNEREIGNNNTHRLSDQLSGLPTGAAS